MTNFATITFRSGITVRPALSTDVEGSVKVGKSTGTLKLHSSRESADAFVEDFWKNKGYKK